MEVVLLHQLGTAERKHVGVNVSAGQFRPQVIGPLLRISDGLRDLGRDDLPVLTDLEPVSISRSFTRVRIASNSAVDPNRTGAMTSMTRRIRALPS
jgi:hypothetical protein